MLPRAILLISFRFVCRTPSQLEMLGFTGVCADAGGEESQPQIKQQNM